MSDIIETPDFASMEIGQLRKYAAHMRLAIAKTSTKVDIIEAIERKLNGRVMPEFASEDTKVKPGYAKIIVLEDPMPDAANLPVYVGANGYVATLPRGIPLIVPMRVVRLLNDAKVTRRKQSLSLNADGRESFKETSVTSPSYPYQILDMTPGPELVTSLEAGKQRTAGPKRRYRQLFGRWPRPKELTRAIEQKLISLGDDEILDASTESMLGTDVEA